MFRNIQPMKDQQFSIDTAQRTHNDVHQYAYQSRIQSIVKENVRASSSKMAYKNWTEAIVFTKGRVNSSWDLVGTVFGNSIKRRVELFPFQANKAVWNICTS